MGIQKLTDISHYYGSNVDYVIAGGGNTSFKDETTLYIKGSGTTLSDICPEGFVKMDRAKLARIWENAYPPDPDAREAAVLTDMMAARMPGEEQKRPSVETLLHDVLPFAYVVHTHPAIVNGLTCSQQGEQAMTELFGEDAIWIPITNPGYILSLEVKNAQDAYTARRGKPADIIFLQNHGVFVGADTTEAIDARYTRITGTLEKRIHKKPDFAHTSDAYRDSAKIGAVLAELAGQAVFERNNEFARLTENAAAFHPVSSAFTPDHIVYAGSDPLFIALTGGGAPADHIRDAWKKHVNRTGRAPKIAAVQGLGVFGLGQSEKTARLALELFTDTAKVAVYAEAFGGGRFMTADKIDFINNWEVERYRSKVAESK
ncbi:short-chain dehydrogenase [Spirochaetia bacterium]|nr:short-chain dehydrogenase [Spirochaetia bacterium]